MGVCLDCKPKYTFSIKDNKKCKPCMTNCYKCYNMTNCI